MSPSKTNLSQETCLTLKASISALLDHLAVEEKKKASSFLAESPLSKAQHQELERMLTLTEAILTLKGSFLILSNRLLRLVLVQAGTLSPIESLDNIAHDAQKKIEEATRSCQSDQLDTLSKSFLEKQTLLEKEILRAAHHIQELKKNPKELESPENFYQKIAAAFSNVTQDQKKLEDQTKSIIAVATNLLNQQRNLLPTLFSTVAELESKSTFESFLEQLQRFQKTKDLFADLASALLENSFSQHQLIKKAEHHISDIISELHQQEASIGNLELTNLIEQFLEGVENLKE